MSGPALTDRQRRAGERFAARYPELASEIAALAMEMGAADVEAARAGFGGKSLSATVERLPAWGAFMGRRQIAAITLPDPQQANLTLLPPFGDLK